MAGSSTSADTGNTHRNVASGHSVFLSHSGAQKDFVEQLCADLESCNRSPFFDKRSDSLPKGEPFPKHIFKAIRQCQVGVVVLSEEFFCSKWPMLELVEMSKTMKSSNLELKIMPVFLGVSPAQCRDEMNQRRWLSIWREWAQQESRINISEWEAALKLLGPTNGFTYKVGLGEFKFRKEIVKEICKVVPPATTWDDSHVQGRSRLCEVICDKIEAIRPCGGVCVVGVYGVGGIGKTTLCKSLCKEFFMKFRGKVCHAELKEGGSKIELLRVVLKRLTNTSEKALQGFNEDECRELLKKNINKQRVFLTIDNVSDSSKCLEEANIYLQAKHDINSVVIVTARSLDQLRLLKIEERDCLEMPELEKDEARSLFLYYATHVSHVQYASEVEVKVDEEIIMRCLKKCYFCKGPENRYHYHPLALEVLGRQFGYNLEPWNVQLDAVDTFNQLRERESEHPVFSILRKSFDTLAHEDQLLFMDAAIFNPEEYELWNRDIFKWLSLVHGVSLDVINRRLMGLKRKSVIEELGNGSRSIVMHDLWREFAVLETKIGETERQRWVYDVLGNPSFRSEECAVVDIRFGGGWVNLQRICMMRTERNWLDMEVSPYLHSMHEINLSFRMKLMQVLLSCILICTMQTGESTRSMGVTDNMPVDEVNFGYCANVTVLKLLRAKLKVLDLSALRHLRSLEYDFGTRLRIYSDISKVEVRGLGVLSNLVVLLLDGIPGYSSWIQEISGLTKLQILRLESGNWQVTDKHENKYPDLKRLCLLRYVTIKRFFNRTNTISGFSEKMSNLRILDLSECSFLRCAGVGDLVALEELNLRECRKLKELPNLQRLTKLRILNITYCVLIRALPGFGALVALEELEAAYCSKIAQLPDLHKLIHLQVLNLYDCRVSALLGLGNVISLRKIYVPFEGLEDCHDLQKLTKLRMVEVTGWSSQGLACLSTLPKLEDLSIWKCEGVEVLNGLLNLTSLLVLTISECDFKDMSCVSHFSTLRELRINYCDKLERLPDIHRLTRLESLHIWWCRSLRIWEGLRGSRLLETPRSDTESSDWVLPLLIETLKCNGVPVTELPDVRSFPHLKVLDLHPPPEPLWHLMDRH